MKEVKLVGISASPKKGPADFMLDTAMDAAVDIGAEACFLVLRSLNLHFVGEGDSDDFAKIFPKIAGADVILFASPAYPEGTVAPQLLNLIDRLRPYSDSLKNKRAGIIISGSEGSQNAGNGAVAYLRKVCEEFDMYAVGAVLGKGDKISKMSKDKRLVMELNALARNVLEPRKIKDK